MPHVGTDISPGRPKPKLLNFLKPIWKCCGNRLEIKIRNLKEKGPCILNVTKVNHFCHRRGDFQLARTLCSVNRLSCSEVQLLCAARDLSIRHVYLAHKLYLEIVFGD